MFNTKMIVGTALLASTLLVGCSNEPTPTEVAINAQLNQVSSDVQYAKAEADRANQRLDNLAQVRYIK